MSKLLRAFLLHLINKPFRLLSSCQHVSSFLRLFQPVLDISREWFVQQGHKYCFMGGGLSLTLVFCSNENKSCMRVDESWQARVCVRIFLALMSWSNENKSCMRVDEREFV